MVSLFWVEQFVMMLIMMFFMSLVMMLVMMLFMMLVMMFLNWLNVPYLILSIVLMPLYNWCFVGGFSSLNIKYFSTKSSYIEGMRGIFHRNKSTFLWVFIHVEEFQVSSIISWIIRHVNTLIFIDKITITIIILVDFEHMVLGLLISLHNDHFVVVGWSVIFWL